MKECTVCIGPYKNQLYPLHCPDGLENPNHCIDIVTDELLKTLMAKGFGIVYHAFYAIQPKGSSEADAESDVRIELVFNEVYDSKIFEGLGGSFKYRQSAYCAEFLEGKSPNFALNFRRPQLSVLLYRCFYNAEIVNSRMALLGVVEAMCRWCDECL